MVSQGYHQNIPYGATTPIGSSCRMGVPETGDLLPEPTHYSTTSHRKKTPKYIIRNTLLPIIKNTRRQIN